MPPHKDRSNFLRDIAEDVDALTVKVVSAERYERAPGLGHDGVFRRKPEQQTHRLTGPSLLQQLTAALVPGSGGGSDESVGRGKPAGRSPSCALASGALRHIDLEAGRLLRDLRTMGVATPRRPLVRRTISGDIEQIRAAAHNVTDLDVLRDIAASVRRWVQRARLALTYEAETYTLTDRCPYCGGELRVRADNESPVMCAGSPASRTHGERRPPCLDEEGNRRSWPKSAWVLLLDRLNAG